LKVDLYGVLESIVVEVCLLPEGPVAGFEVVRVQCGWIAEAAVDVDNDGRCVDGTAAEQGRAEFFLFYFFVPGLGFC
jgi:hypothetical protein